MRTPAAYRPIEYEYFIIGSILMRHNIWDWTEQKFIEVVMSVSNGGINPNRVKALYHIFMNEARLEPLYDAA